MNNLNCIFFYDINNVSFLKTADILVVARNVCKIKLL